MRADPFLASFAVALLTTPPLAVLGAGDIQDTPAHSPAEERAMFHVPPGFEIQLVASEPEIQKPINLNFDAAGRLWMSGSTGYPWPASTDPNGTVIPDFQKGWSDLTGAFRVGTTAPQPIEEGRDKVRVLSDFAPDGHARQITTFADKLSIPIGVQPLPRAADMMGDSALVYSIPQIWRMTDRDGHGKAEQRTPLYGRFGFTDTHGMSSNYVRWIDGWVYGCHGFRNESEVRGADGAAIHLSSGNTYRFREDGSHIEVWTHGQTNPFGLTFDARGDLYSCDSHSKPAYQLLRGGYYEGISKRDDGLGFGPWITQDSHGSTAIAGIADYVATQYPPEYRDCLYIGNVVTNKVHRDKLVAHGSTNLCERQPDFVTCDDPWFRPVNIKLGPDGALYVADFYNPIIGHYEVPLTHPKRDHVRGRIWRVVWKGEDGTAAVPQMPDLTKLSPEQLIAELANSNLTVRNMATNEYVDRSLEEKRQTTREAAARRDFKLDQTEVKTAHALWIFARLGLMREFPIEDWAANPSALVRTHLARILAERKEWTSPQAAAVLKMLHDSDAFVRRAAADALGRHPDAANLESLLALWTETPAEDTHLIYTAQVALRDHLLMPGMYATAQAIADHDEEKAKQLANVTLAVPHADAAAFLLAWLQKTPLTPGLEKCFEHVVKNIADPQLADAFALTGRAASAPLPVRFSVFRAMARGAQGRGVKLPADLGQSTADVALQALASPDVAMVKQGIELARDSKVASAREPLEKLAASDAKLPALREAAMEAAVTIEGDEAIPMLRAAMADASSGMKLRQRAGDLLAALNSDATRQELAAQLPHAPAALGASLAAGLAKSPAGARVLIETVEAGHASPTLLLEGSVAGALRTSGSPELTARATKLTASLLPQADRVQQLIAQRIAGFSKAKTDPLRGKATFTTICAACHRVAGEGNNVGPALDGIGVRGVDRLTEDVLDPNRNVDPAFWITNVETKDGRTTSGLGAHTDGQVLVLTDVTGKESRVPLSEVKTQTVSKLSLMPNNFGDAFPEPDFYNLLAYLLTLREPAQAH